MWKHTQEADFRTQMHGVASDLQQSCGAGAKQQVVGDLLVLQSQPRKLVWQREYNMDVADRQEFLASSSQPLVAGVRLAFWAVAITAGAV